jgi:hypothetical protein
VTNRGSSWRARFCAWQERALLGLGVSLLARRPRGAGVRLLYDDNRHSRARLGGEFSASEEGRNVYIGVGTVLAIILIIVLLVWISREGVLRDKH